MIKECANPKCKKSFQAKRKTQKYCSGKCRKYVEKNKNVDHEETKIDGVPLREFYCRECGGRVVIKKALELIGGKLGEYTYGKSRCGFNHRIYKRA